MVSAQPPQLVNTKRACKQLMNRRCRIPLRLCSLSGAAGISGIDWFQGALNRKYPHENIPMRLHESHLISSLGMH
jgi:hypothetical protein